MGELKRLPGHGCRFFARGRCLYEERLNPGYTKKWRCGVLLRWESVYDDFLVRAEAFGLEEDELSELWRERLERLMLQEGRCERYVYSRHVELPSCGNSHETLCLLDLPRCEGRCRRFALNDQE